MSVADKHQVEPAQPGRWPAASTKQHYWDAPLATPALHRRGLAAGPYLANSPAHIASVNWLPEPALMARAEAAALAATRFEANLNEDIRPYTAFMLRSEAAASSQIENLSASARSILQAEIGDTSKQNATLIAGNTQAMLTAIIGQDSITENSILKIHGVLTAADPGALPGRLREEPVWIGGSSPIDARFVGADSANLPALINDLVEYCGRTDVPVVVQAAIAHAQFETIHPFLDGNGRTGRVLTQQIIRQSGALSKTVLPLSGYLLTQVSAYYQALDEYREGQPQAMIRLMSDSIFAAIQNAQIMVADIDATRLEWNKLLQVRSDSGARQLVDYSLRQPVFTSEIACAELNMSTASFYRNAKTLCEAGILIRSKFHRDSDVWRAPRLIEAMEDFAQRCGFRRPGY